MTTDTMREKMVCDVFKLIECADEDDFAVAHNFLARSSDRLKLDRAHSVVDAILSVLESPTEDALEAAWLPVSGKFDVGYVDPAEVTLEILRLYIAAIKAGA